ncbi:MAG: hypothetical protein ACRERU_04045 [Methylococcales bacterium]
MRNETQHLSLQWNANVGFRYRSTQPARILFFKMRIADIQGRILENNFVSRRATTLDLSFFKHFLSRFRKIAIDITSLIAALENPTVKANTFVNDVTDKKSLPRMVATYRKTLQGNARSIQP